MRLGSVIKLRCRIHLGLRWAALTALVVLQLACGAEEANPPADGVSGNLPGLTATQVPPSTAIPAAAATVVITVTPATAPSATSAPTPAPTPTLQPTPAPTPTLQPTPAPTPTLQPTPAPTPTVTPTPVPAPTPPRLAIKQSKQLGNVDLERLFDEIISQTEQRESFSEIKERNIQFSALEDMKKLRSEFVASETEAELYYSLMKLSNARRDAHLHVSPVEGGLPRPERPPCVSAPIQVLPDYSDIHNPSFFVAAVGEGVTSPNLGDVIVGVNGQPIPGYIAEFTPWVRHSTLPLLYLEGGGRLA